MSTFGGPPQHKVSRANRVPLTRATATNAAATAHVPTRRANSIAAMPSSVPFSGNVNASCACGTASHGQKLSTEVWDPFQSDYVPPGCQTSSKDLLRSMQQRRGQSRADAGGQPPPCPRPPPRNYCDSGESDSSVLENGRRTTEFLYDVFCEQKLCDVVLRCGGDGNTVDTIHAHKVQLQQQSWA